MNNLRSLVSEQLREFRELKGLQQTELARRAGVSREVVGKIERGETSPTLETLSRLCQVLRVPLAEFFTPKSGNEEKDAVERLCNYLSTKKLEHIQFVEKLAKLAMEQLEDEQK